MLVRRLLYVPIIHTEADMGSLAPQIDSGSASVIGRRRWTRHQEVVVSFWKAIEDYLATLDGANLKIYQDGLAADGDLGRKIVEESAKGGSKNYQIVLHLMNRGAEIRKTEDVPLLLEEYNLIRNLIKRGSGSGSLRDYANYKSREELLTKERDQYIARRINESLREGEIGILFLGAYHNVLPHLEKDILVKSVKDQDKIRAYFDELVMGHDGDRFEELARYLASTVDEDV